MGAFDYKDYTTAEAADLAALSHQLAIYSATKSFAGIPTGEALEGLQKLIGEGTLTGSPIDMSLPATWSEIDPLSLGIPAAHIDRDGYVMMESPIYGFAQSGPQLLLLEERDAAGNVVRLSVSFTATNSLLDVLDYTQLNTGEMAESMIPVLEALRDYAQSLGLTGDDVLVTGYSLGAGYANIMARFADTLADGFFADADYVAHAVPVIYDDPDRVLNIGYENDVVHRAAGDHATIAEAIAAADPFLSNPDTNYATSTDNLVIFDGSYSVAAISLAVDSLLNIAGSWWAHIGGVATDAIRRIGDSRFYEFTERDSVMIVSNLGADLRWNTWVEDKAAPTSDHFGAPAFIIGTQYNDLLGDGRGNDWIDAGAGDDRIRVSSGYNRVDGGEGYDTLRVQGRPEDHSAYRLSDGTLVIVGKDGVTLAENIEDIEFAYRGFLGIETVADYSIHHDRLEDDRWSLFEWRDHDLRFGKATEGTGGNDVLTGKVVFGMAGDDLIRGTAGADLLIGGEGADTIRGGAGADRIYGGEHDDWLYAESNGDRLNGGHGDDVFVFVQGLTGSVVVEDFNAAANESDRLLIEGLSDADALLASARQDGNDVVLRHDGFTLRLEHTDLADLSASDFLLA
ncbi:MAG: hypothetical protein Q4G24_08050 [Paracoccus sp. (in: a-proteobacteria)]|nr:hypothetical protein [Paracoccus sp. (in: a-proteobacteria)]